MISRKKMILLSVILMFEMVFLANHWNDYVFTPMNPNEVLQINLEVYWKFSTQVIIYKEESILAIIEVEDLLRKNDNTCFLLKSSLYAVKISYVLQNGTIIERNYQEQRIHAELERALLKIEEVKEVIDQYQYTW